MTSTASTEIWRDIRPYLDSEVHDAVEQLLADQEFCSLLDQVLPNQAEALKQGMLKSQTIREIKRHLAVIYRALLASEEILQPPL